MVILLRNTGHFVLLEAKQAKLGSEQTGEIITGWIFGLDLKMKKLILLGCLTLLAGVQSAAVETVNADVIVDSVDRSIDIASQLVKINTKLTLTNNGKGAISGFHYGLEEAAKAKLAFIGATVRKSFGKALVRSNRRILLFYFFMVNILPKSF